MLRDDAEELAAARIPVWAQIEDANDAKRMEDAGAVLIDFRHSGPEAGAAAEPRAFYEYIAPHERRRARTGALLVAAMMPLFMPVDYFVYPAQVSILWTIRSD